MFKCLVFTILSALMLLVIPQVAGYVPIPELCHLDDYDRCMLYGDEALYCNLMVHLFPKNAENASEVWRIIEEKSSSPTTYKHYILRHRRCIPEVLPTFPKTNQEVGRQLTDFYNQMYEHQGIKSEVTVEKCKNNESSYPVDVYALVFAIFCIIYISVVIYASLYEEIIRHKDAEEQKKLETKFGRYVLALSLRKNWNRLMTVSLPTKDMQSLSCIQGVRFYNILWVILIHTVLCNVATFTSDPQYIESTTSDELGLTLFDSTFAMQNFFMISSWLLAYNFFKDMEKKEGVGVGYFFRNFAKRYFRLTPTLAFLVAFCATWIVHLSRGPVWDDIIAGEYIRCRQNWWATLLYINNLVDERKKCFVHGWYLTLNMQYYVISLFLLWVMWKWQKWIPAILGSGLLAHMVLSFRIFYDGNYRFSLRLSPEDLYLEQILEVDQFHDVYTSAVTNFSSVIAGLAYGYIFFRIRNKQLFTKKIHIVLWWILPHTVELIVILLPSIVTINPRVNPVFNAFYGSVWRALFIFSSGMIVLGMCQGQGWIVRWLCESKTIYILGRLTYSAYLIHPLLQRIRMGIKRFPSYVTTSVIVLEGLGDMTWGFVGGLILTLLIEIPSVELYKLLTTKRQNVVKDYEDTKPKCINEKTEVK